MALIKTLQMCLQGAAFARSLHFTERVTRELLSLSLPPFLQETGLLSVIRSTFLCNHCSLRWHRRARTKSAPKKSLLLSEPQCYVSDLLLILILGVRGFFRQLRKSATEQNRYTCLQYVYTLHRTLKKRVRIHEEYNIKIKMNKTPYYNSDDNGLRHLHIEDFHSASSYASQYRKSPFLRDLH